VTAAITTFLLKVASRCNLDCDYCYVYRGPDQSWRRKPHVMSLEVLDAALGKIAAHVVRHKLEKIAIVLHGGEPLLAGTGFIETVFREATRRVPCAVEFGMQSNLTLLTTEVIELFRKYGATIGVSLDGPRSANDRHRVTHDARSSFDDVVSGLDLLRTTPGGSAVFSGLLAVIDLQNDPVETYRFLAGFQPRGIDFLLPDATHDLYPPGKKSFQDTPYSDWLIRLFDYWWQEPNPIPIRLFENIISLWLGGVCDTEYLGTGAADLLVIESNGGFEAVDTLKVAFDGAPGLDLDVFRHSVDDAVAHPKIAQRLIKDVPRTQACTECPKFRICGGGYLPHRFSKQSQFLNPSVFCYDLFALIEHITQSEGLALRGTRALKSRTSS
jgi:radical SAM/SPASM domain FxsB family protein